MNPSNKIILALVASFLPLTIACGGSTGEVDTSIPAAPAASAPSQNDGGAPSTSTNPSDGGSTPDGGATTTSDAGTGATTFGANCNIAVTDPTLCIENVSGHAGQVIDLPIDLLGTVLCPTASEASGHIILSDYFLLVNPVQQIDCISRDNYSAPAPDTTEIMWDNFGNGSIGACPNPVVSGRLDNVQVEIIPGTPSGDYQVTWYNEGLPSPVSACAQFGGGIGATIHVD